MQFSKVFAEVAAFLDREKAEWAICGGVALAALGMPRTTLDLDFVVVAGMQTSVVGFMESLGYKTLHRSVGYSNHLHADSGRGRVDFIYVRGETAARLFAGSRRVPGPAGLPVPVPRPEHLAAMKLAAFRADPSRELQEMADIQFLLTVEGVDRSAIRESFARYDLAEKFDEIEKQL